MGTNADVRIYTMVPGRTVVHLINGTPREVQLYYGYPENPNAKPMRMHGKKERERRLRQRQKGMIS